LSKVQRISPTDANRKVAAGEALLVCAYESEDTFKLYPLAGTVSFQTFKESLKGLPPDREIIFYCN
jgi:hypothetical protein